MPDTAQFILNRLTPADLGLNFIPLTFNIRDQQTDQPLKISAWWIPQSFSDILQGVVFPTH